MSDGFVLLDLPTQASSVQRVLQGKSSEEKLAWLNAHGRLESIPMLVPGARPSYLFESGVGLRCAFFIDGDVFVFYGDNTTYTVN